MTTIDSKKAGLLALRDGLLENLAGMDYCLDWKPSEDDWSAREVAYHLLDTPPGGMAKVVDGVVSGTLTEYEIWSDRANITDERATKEMADIESDISAFFAAFIGALAPASDDDLDNLRVIMHQRTRDEDVERTLEEALSGFGRHWGSHLEQLAELRAALGL